MLIIYAVEIHWVSWTWGLMSSATLGNSQSLSLYKCCLLFPFAFLSHTFIPILLLHPGWTLQIVSVLILSSPILICLASFFEVLFRYNLYAMKFNHLKCTLVFSIFTCLCSLPHNLILEYFHHPQKKTCTINTPSPLLLSSSFGQTPIYFLFL